MYFWNSYPFIRFSVALILGIVLYEEFPWLWDFPIITVLGLTVLLSLSLFLSTKFGFHKLRHLNGFIALATILFMGGWTNQLHYHRHPAHHYKNQNQILRGFSGTIVSTATERRNHHRYDFMVENIFTDSLRQSSGTIHLYIQKDSSNSLTLTYGDQLVVKGSFYSIPPSGNPSEFNYKTYLEQGKIYAHAFVNPSEIQLTGHKPPNPVLNFAYALRENASNLIDRYISEKRESAIAKALLLGIKDHLDNDVKRAYSAAGAMHVLAVSGLHVGIIYLLIRILFGKIQSQGRHGKLFFTGISLTIIWLYALVTGLSPSVMRAATMFSLVIVGEASAKSGNIYNTLGFAAFVLLLYDPYFLYSVGFQLSFAAVFGIVYFQPKIYHIYDSRFWLIDKAWAITSVSIAAQLATFPLTSYYFHQFPTYFLLSNLVVIPAAFIMLVAGVIMLILGAVIPFLGEVLGEVLYRFMWVVNECISWIESLPNSLLEWIYMDKEGMFLTYLIVMTLAAAFHFKSLKTLVVSALFGFFYIGWTIHTNVEQSRRHQLIFYQVKDQIAIDHINGHEATLYLDAHNQADLEVLSLHIDPYRLSSHLKPIKGTIEMIDSVFRTSHESLRIGSLAHKRMVFFDSTTFHLDFSTPIETDVILINNGSVKSLEWLLRNFSADYIVVGNQNSSYYTRRIGQEAENIGAKIHLLRNDGALVMDL